MFFDWLRAKRPDLVERYEALYRNGVTNGCVASPRQYCPEVGMTRGQMASFLLLSKEGPGYTPSPCTTPPFSDVPV